MSYLFPLTIKVQRIYTKGNTKAIVKRSFQKIFLYYNISTGSDGAANTNFSSINVQIFANVQTYNKTLPMSVNVIYARVGGISNFETQEPFVLRAFVSSLWSVFLFVLKS